MKGKAMPWIEDIYVTWTERGLWLGCVLYLVWVWWRLRKLALDLRRRLGNLYKLLIALEGKPRA